MKVILLKNIPKLGKKDTVIEVADGYAQNALFPHKFAIPATPQALSTLKRTQDALVAQDAVSHTLFMNAVAAIPDKTVTLAFSASEEGSLFAQVHPKDVARALAAQGIAIDPKLVLLPEDIKKLGTYTIQIKEKEGTQWLPLSLAIVRR